MLSPMSSLDQATPPPPAITVDRRFLKVSQMDSPCYRNPVGPNRADIGARSTSYALLRRAATMTMACRHSCATTPLGPLPTVCC
jgi:hypothetical protein